MSFTLDDARHVNQLTFQGDPDNPLDTPTVYELQAMNMETGQWERLMSGSHPRSEGHNERTHLIDNECQLYE